MRFHSPVQPIPLTVGQQVHLAGDPNPWTVKATTENFVALTRLTTKQEVDTAEWLADPDDEHWENPYEEGETLYTVLDWRNGVRGPCNLSGQAYGDGDYTEAECAQMLAEFEAGELVVSHRNQVTIRFGRRRHDGARSGIRTDPSRRQSHHHPVPANPRRGAGRQDSRLGCRSDHSSRRGGWLSGVDTTGPGQIRQRETGDSPR